MKYPPNMFPKRKAEYEARNDEIRKLRSAGLSTPMIAEIFGLSQPRVSQIVGRSGFTATGDGRKSYERQG